jgi:carbon-monoxide dehydrogenase small subunit
MEHKVMGDPIERGHAAESAQASNAVNVEQTMHLRLQVNGERIDREVLVRQHLVDFLREDLGLTGSHLGCEHGVCGACSVLVDGELVRGCLMLAVQAQGRQVQTIEALSDSGELAVLQQAFLEHNAMQCGFCTPGMLLTARALMQEVHVPGREKIREYISGNYCRCTGYQAIVDAIETAIKRRHARGALHEAVQAQTSVPGTASVSGAASVSATASGVSV